MSHNPAETHEFVGDGIACDHYAPDALGMITKQSRPCGQPRDAAIHHRAGEIEVPERSFSLLAEEEYVRVYKCNNCNATVKQTPASADPFTSHVCNTADDTPATAETQKRGCHCPGEFHQPKCHMGIGIILDSERSPESQAAETHEFRPSPAPGSDYCVELVVSQERATCGQPRDAAIHRADAPANCAWCGQPPETSAVPGQPPRSVRCSNRACIVRSHGWTSPEFWTSSRSENKQ